MNHPPLTTGSSSIDHSAPSELATSPSNRSHISVQEFQDSHQDDDLLVDAFELNQRRKASMSKLMRHFGETRIPPELVLQAPTQDAITVRKHSTEQVPRRKKGKTKSLDLRPLVQHRDAGVLENQADDDQENQDFEQPKVHRARSLNARTGQGRPLDLESSANLLDVTNAEVSHDRVRSARKMTQVCFSSGPRPTGCEVFGKTDMWP